jgi:hypothetical protein
MAHQPQRGWNILGVSVQGDLGGITYYTSATRKLVAFAKAPPLNPPSQKQLEMRQAWSDAAAEWRDLTNDQRTKWKQITDHVRLRVTGYNLWIWYWRTRDEGSLRTIERKLPYELARPVPLGS